VAYTVFLSHNAADAQWVKLIAENASRVGIEVYLYEHDLRPGQMVAEKVQTAIKDCDALVVLLTANSQFSAYVQQEVGSAKALQKPVIPLVEPGFDRRCLAMLEGIEYIRFEFQNPGPGLAALLEYLQKAKLGKEESMALLAVGALVETAAHAKLSPTELHVLRNVPDDGMIELLNSPQAPFLRLGRKTLPSASEYDPASAARYLDALESLQDRGLLRHKGGVLFSLTGRGFDLRKGLLEDQGAPSK
jgi:hypothetical protein